MLPNLFFVTYQALFYIAKKEGGFENILSDNKTGTSKIDFYQMSIL